MNNREANLRSFSRSWRRQRDLVLIAGGGTGGHLYPGLVLGRELVEQTGALVMLVGRNSEQEKRICADHGFLHIGLEIQGLRRRLGLQALQTAYKLATALPVARRLIATLRPTLVIGTGGYAAAPTLWAARSYGVPFLLQEQNVVPGRVTRWFAAEAEAVCATFVEAGEYLTGNVLHSGQPIRPASLARTPTPAECEQLGLDPGRFTVLVFGGSQGARKLGETMLQLANQLGADAGMQVLLITGPRNYDALAQQPRPAWLALAPYMDDMGLAYGLADVVVGRAGAATIAELATNGIASILVPLAIAADDHQRKNAAAYAAGGGALVLDETELNAETLGARLCRLRDDPAQRKAMAQQAKTTLHLGAAATIARLAGQWLLPGDRERMCA